MNKAKTHIYFIPGMAAGKEIFSAITLPKENYVIHVVEWMIPEKNETLINLVYSILKSDNTPKDINYVPKDFEKDTQEIKTYLAELLE